MRHFYRFIILSLFLLCHNAYAYDVFLDALYWRPTETNDWAYINSETVPSQTISYKTINFNYAPGFRIGAIYTGSWDALLSYTQLYSSTNDSATGNIQPAFVGSVTAKPSAAYLYSSGNVRQTIDYNIIDVLAGKQFFPTPSLMLHPVAGIMGGKINQAIYANYYGSTTSHEKIINNFTGIGPKIGIDMAFNLINCATVIPKFIAGFASSYQIGNWDISDTTNVQPTSTVIVNGANHSMGALTLQGFLGFNVDYKKLSVKLIYEINDWFDQSQFFDNDTGAHNNELVLQGLTAGVTYQFE